MAFKVAPTAPCEHQDEGCRACASLQSNACQCKQAIISTYLASGAAIAAESTFVAERLRKRWCRWYSFSSCSHTCITTDDVNSGKTCRKHSHVRSLDGLTFLLHRLLCALHCTAGIWSSCKGATSQSAPGAAGSAGAAHR